jgi:hypothetical protein
MHWLMPMPLNTLHHQPLHCHDVNSSNGKTLYSCGMKWHCCITYMQSYLTCPKSPSTMAPTHYAYPR